MFKRFISTMMMFVIILSVLTSCTSITPSKDREGVIRIAMIPKIVGISYFDKCAEGAKEVAESYGMELIYKGPTTADAASQVNIIQDMIYSNVDVIAIAPIDPEAVKPMLLKARARGIKVVTFDADAAIESRDVFVNQVSAEVLGKHMVDNMAQLLGGQGQYAIMTASLTADNQNTWIKWMQTYQAQAYKDLELVTIIPNDEDQQKAYVNTRNLIQAYPELDGIIAMSTVVGPGAAKAVEAMKMNGDIQLYVLSLPNDIRPYIESGAIQLGTLWDPYQLGALTIEVANRLINDQSISDGEMIVDIGPIRYDAADHVVIMGQPLDFTTDNINDYDF